MKYKIRMNNSYHLIAGMLMLVAPIAVSAIDPSNKEIRSMEEHWRMVTNEPDTSKRNKLIEEHRDMMSGYSSIKVPGHDGPMDDIHNHDRDMRLKNTVDMHSAMLDMMH